MRRSVFIARLFAVLFALLLVVQIAAGLGIYSYARRVVGEEFIRLNRSSLQQVADATARTLSEVRTFGERVAVNSTMLELAERSDEQARKEARRLLNNLMTEYMSRTNSISLMETCVLGNGGLRAAAYNTDEFSLDALRQDERLAPLLAGETDQAMLPTHVSAQGTGVMVYTFQMVLRMDDLFSGETKGLVVLDLSELILCQQYSTYQKEGVTFWVVDSDGTIVSSKDKGKIGTYCGYTPQELENIARNEQSLKDGFILCERISGTDWYLVEWLDSAIAFEPLTQVGSVIMAIIALCGVLLFCALSLTARRLQQRVNRINDKMEQVIQGDLSVRIPVEHSDEFGRIESEFNSMVAEIDRLIREVRQGEQQKRLAELDFLQAQINPHFIHNTLTSIRFMLEMGKVREAGEMIFYFSKLLRRTISRSNEFITLEEEVRTLEDYVNLQKFRYQDSFEASYDISPQTLNARVPALILQPVVENAIFHSVGRSMVHISISARREDSQLILVVEDDGVGMSRELRETVLHKDVQVNRVGLRNVHDRIQLNYGKEYGLAITEREGHGTRVTFRLPFQESESDGKGAAE
ncbi:cache domain-containing sensor histidine kinase [Candidatus Allofournierella merdipullorum]|uniref:cache domain-containing sensor histidine kinase n=1 Tax=Candidatus Allofournierella merdipullorum TaxID=2838595 RepID=UPI003AB21D78